MKSRSRSRPAFPYCFSLAGWERAFFWNSTALSKSPASAWAAASLAETHLALDDPAAAELIRLAPDGWEAHHDAAAILARCAAAARDESVREAYARRAIDLLTEAVGRGLRDAKALRAEAFVSLRPRGEYRRLLDDLTKKQ
jgi:hypothetical protein